MTTNTEEVVDKFMQDKFRYDSLCQAVKIAKSEDVDDKLVKPLIMEKQKMKKAYTESTAKLLRSMTLSSNIKHLGGHWYAIRYINEKADTLLKIEPLQPSDIYMLQRDARHERELSRVDLENLVPSIIDESALEVYKQRIQSSGLQILQTEVGIDVTGFSDNELGSTEWQEGTPVAEDDYGVLVRIHAGRRWVERVLGIKGEQEIENYRKAHWSDIKREIVDAFNEAEKVWEDDDGILYWFDKNNIMYVQGHQDDIPTIITLYEEDFGFTKDINRMITLKQLEVLTQSKQHLDEQESKVEGVVREIEHEVQTINDKIKVLESEIALLVATRSKLQSEREQVDKEVKLARDQYTAEFNKLFTKWEV